MRPTQAQFEELLTIVAATRADEIDCEALLARVGAYLEILERGDAVPASMHAVVQHLEVCPGCKEELDALLELLLGA